ncbi:unnamed protein product [Ilex paraguariensis]|uniref:Bulb-type lectin domain-containing protein n=1 Tax=Ilex paraguariensis TaxID=185542 RepID=A0ABC8UKN0_9AQUA
MGNLVLFDRNNATVWQSFDQPTDCLVPGQKLLSGQKLIASIQFQSKCPALEDGDELVGPACHIPTLRA